MDQLKATTTVRVSDLSLGRQLVPADQLVAGEPYTGAATVGEFAQVTVGVWEMTPGVMRDVEVDEVFVVLSGTATVEFTDDTPTFDLRAGDIGRLTEGSRTIWTVTETLRKVSLTPTWPE